MKKLFIMLYQFKLGLIQLKKDYLYKKLILKLKLKLKI